MANSGTPRGQFLDDFERPRHRARYRFVKSRPVRLDMRRILRVERDQLAVISASGRPASCWKCHSGVTTLVRNQSSSSLILDQLGKQMPQIPLDQHAPDIEHDRRDFGHLTILGNWGLLRRQRQEERRPREVELERQAAASQPHRLFYKFL